MKNITRIIVLTFLWSACIPLQYQLGILPKHLKLDQIDVPLSINDIYGNYVSVNLRGHFGEFNLTEENKFEYKYGNSVETGKYFGTFQIKDSLIILSADSLYNQNIIDLIHNRASNITQEYSRLKFEFIITSKGFHEKSKNDNYYKEPTYLKQ